MKRRIYNALFRLFIVCVMMVSAIRCTTDSLVDTSNPNPGNGTMSTTEADQEVKDWMVDYMKKNYLWNRAMENVTPDYTLAYDLFLTGILEAIAAQGDINHDDGYWVDGRRQYFYSNIQRYESTTASSTVTRGTRTMAEGSGITSIMLGIMSQERVFILGGVAPNSPAGQAGLKRGDIVVQVDGEPIGTTLPENQEAANRMVYPAGQVTVTVRDASGQGTSELSYAWGSYEDNPVWKSAVLERPDGQKVGYLCYDSFNYYYDDELLATLRGFQTAGIDELVLDLRYNGGGHVVSSAVLGTFVAGVAHQGAVYTRMTYNEDRMAASDAADVFRIGMSDYGSASYNRIAQALSLSVGLNRIYVICSGSTASASELVINGLRGLDIEVRLIGETTNGKNVGMESVTKTFGDYEYVFSPITFYSENAKGSSDYSGGFIPDVVASEASSFIPIRDWGSPDDGLLALALQWIDSGVKPVVPTRAAADAPQRVRFASPDKSVEGMIVCRE